LKAVNLVAGVSRATRRPARAEYVPVAALRNKQDRIDGRRLAHARAASDDERLALRRQRDRRLARLGKLQADVALDPRVASDASLAAHGSAIVSLSAIVCSAR